MELVKIERRKASKQIPAVHILLLTNVHKLSMTDNSITQHPFARVVVVKTSYKTFEAKLQYDRHAAVK
jgi:hypothetical protein